MSEQLVRLLAWCVLALLFLFLLRVLRAVWASVATPHNRLGWHYGPHRGGRLRGNRSSWRVRLVGRAGSMGPGSNGRAAPAPAAVVVRSPLHAQGERHSLADSLTIGRGEQCDLVIDDNYASQSHARLYRSDGQALLEDLGSTNGTYLNRQKVAAPAMVRIGDFVQIGSTVFEVSA